MNRDGSKRRRNPPPPLPLSNAVSHADGELIPDGVAPPGTALVAKPTRHCWSLGLLAQQATKKSWQQKKCSRRILIVMMLFSKNIFYPEMAVTHSQSVRKNSQSA